MNWLRVSRVRVHGDPFAARLTHSTEEKLMKAVWQGAVVAESKATLFVDGNHYFPPDSVKAEYLRPTRMRALCPWKGVARYHGLDVDGELLRHAAWSYPHPLPWVRGLRDHIAFSSGVEIRPG